jgi:hypothetical protein
VVAHDVHNTGARVGAGNVLLLKNVISLNSWPSTSSIPTLLDRFVPNSREIWMFVQLVSWH